VLPRGNPKDDAYVLGLDGDEEGLFLGGSNEGQSLRGVQCGTAQQTWRHVVMVKLLLTGNMR